MKKLLLFVVAGIASAMAQAEKIDVTTFRYAGPFEIKTPHMVDPTDVNSHEFSSYSLLDASLNAELLNDGHDVDALPAGGESTALHLIGFNIENSRYTGATISVKGVRQYQLFIDGRKMMAGYQRLEPATHQVVIKYLSSPDHADSLRVSVDCDKDDVVKVGAYSPLHKYNFSDVLHGTHFSGASLSPNGKYLIVSYQTVSVGGTSSYKYKVLDAATGDVLAERDRSISWMPKSNIYYYAEGRNLVGIDPKTGARTVIARNVPEGHKVMSPTEDFFICTVTSEGPKEDAGVYEVIEPEDRQPGWRSRSNLAKFDIKTGMTQPLTFGHRNVGLMDISQDGKQILFSVSESHLESRPTTVSSVYTMNLETLQTECLIEKDGFIGMAQFSPDASQVLVSGSPEALGGIGRNLPVSATPSMQDNQLFILSAHNDGTPVKTLTRDFNPSVTRAVWSKFDNNIYFTAEDRDSLNFFQVNTKTMKIRELTCEEEMVMSFSCPSAAPVIAYYGLGASNSDRLYVMNLKNQKSTLIEDLSRETLKNSLLGECHPWTYQNSRGDTIYARYYLPVDFDPSRKYPMVVNYYGGCSPTSRNFESRYPQHAYASLGYIVLVINPSGATGFGQEFSSRHVNTAGEGVAQDIIEGTQQFCQQHQYVNDKKIGCIGASYGGFMTQYLQTVTDIFAAAISHAGISDHTSYWGEGYWGYSYSEVSMANSYPWTDSHLYVDQSPLFRADKVHTPILFLHGDADTNVPVGESIQMYTALKLLGRETSMVLVKGQNHHILDYQKRIRWQNTIFAWFAKYLQDDDSWWESMYPKKSL